jgi:hypothetical protein
MLTRERWNNCHEANNSFRGTGESWDLDIYDKEHSDSSVELQVNMVRDFHTVNGECKVYSLRLTQRGGCSPVADEQSWKTDLYRKFGPATFELNKNISEFTLDLRNWSGASYIYRWCSNLDEIGEIQFNKSSRIIDLDNEELLHNIEHDWTIYSTPKKPDIHL